MKQKAIKEINHLLEQLSSKIEPITMKKLEEVQKNGEIVIIRNGKSGPIVAMGTIIYFQTMTGLLAHIEDVVVDGEHREKGLGRHIVLELIEKAKERGVKHIDLTSSPQRVAANQLYQKVGFKKRETNAYRLVL